MERPGPSVLEAPQEQLAQEGNFDSELAAELEQTPEQPVDQVESEKKGFMQRAREAYYGIATRVLAPTEADSGQESFWRNEDGSLKKGRVAGAAALGVLGAGASIYAAQKGVDVEGFKGEGLKVATKPLFEQASSKIEARLGDEGNFGLVAMAGHAAVAGAGILLEDTAIGDLVDAIADHADRNGTLDAVNVTYTAPNGHRGTSVIDHVAEGTV